MCRVPAYVTNLTSKRWIHSSVTQFLHLKTRIVLMKLVEISQNLETEILSFILWINVMHSVYDKKIFIFTFSSSMRGCWFYVKNKFRNFHRIFRFWGLLSQKKWIHESVCLSPSSLSVSAITLERIIGLDYTLTQFLRSQKEWMSSFTSHFWPTVLVLSIKNVFLKIKSSIYPPKYATRKIF